MINLTQQENLCHQNQDSYLNPIKNETVSKNRKNCRLKPCKPLRHSQPSLATLQERTKMDATPLGFKLFCSSAIAKAPKASTRWGRHPPPRDGSAPSDDGQWDAVELTGHRAGAVAALAVGGSFVSSDTTLPGDSQGYLGRGTCWGAEVRHYLGTPIILGKLLSVRPCEIPPWEFREILGEDLFVN